VRAVAPTGRVHLRWDACKIWLIPAERADADIEEARVELARRFVRWFGPVTMKRFAWWTGLDRRDVRPQWKALEGELSEVEAFGEERFVLEEMIDVLRDPPPATGVRFIPHGDPLIKIDREIVPSDRVDEIFPNPSRKAAFWPVSGALLIDGNFVGSWARQQRKVTVNAWRELSGAERDEVEREALALPIAGRTAPSVAFI
jgi:hypothetical protein